MRSLLPFLSMFFAGTKVTGAMEPTMPFMEYLDQNHLVCLMWGFDNLQGNITFKLVVNTTGWVGFGFSPNGGMKGSDIVMGGLGPTGSYFKDYHGTGNFMPSVDKQQSYTLLSLSETDGQTIMTFQRSIQSCDDQDFDITAQPIKVIYAYGLTDEITNHQARRGTKDINLLNYMPRSTLTNLNHFSATVDNITVPSSHTYYHCKVEPVIKHPDIVHHLLLYRCPSSVTQPYDKQCYVGGTMEACFSVVAAWAVGGGVFELPENVGIPVGGEDSEIFYRLEIHYNNPNRETGRTDSSGLRLYYRPTQPWQYDVGILTTGLLPLAHLEYNIPPMAAQFHTYGVCNTTVFSQLVNPFPDLQVFALLLHTHLAGSKVRVGHYRNGKQIDFLGLDENYNFDKQQIINLGNIKTIKQGDEIAVECTYNTTNRTRVTKMGLATTDEMCLAFLLYYPGIKIASCISHPNTMHPLMNTSSQMSDGNPASHQDEIAEYEGLLKTIPQIQMISDDNFHFSFYENGTIRAMMKTPTITCQDKSASSTLNPSWIVNAARIIVLLVWIAIM